MMREEEHNDLMADKENADVPFLSVVIPFYNTDPSLLKACLESLARQTFKDFEVVMVNNGSRKEVSKAAETLFEGLNLNGCIITQKNMGVSVARNVGTVSSRGAYVTYVDSDDIVAPYLFRWFHEAAQKHAEYILARVARVPYRFNRTGARQLAEPPYKSVDAHVLFDHFLGEHVVDKDELLGFESTPTSRAVRRDIALAHPFSPEVLIGEDTLWNLQVLKDVDNVILVEGIGYLIRSSNCSYTTRYRSTFGEDAAGFLKAVEGICATEKDNRELQKLALVWIYRVFENQLRGIAAGSFKEFRIEFAHMLVQEPWHSALRSGQIETLPVRYRIVLQLLSRGHFLLVAKIVQLRNILRYIVI